MIRNRRNEEISASAYLEFILDYLRHDGGVVEHRVLEDAVQKAYSSVWSAADRRLLEPFGMPKWVNQLAWAKVLGGKAGLLAQRKQGKHSWICLTGVAPLSQDHADMMPWILAGKKGRKNYVRKCPECELTVALTLPACPDCGHVFPVTKKVRKVPK